MTSPLPPYPATEAPRKVHIKSYGCQMNAHDAERMSDLMAGEGYIETSQMEDADLVILNTCHIREKAAEKVYSELGRVRVARDERAGAGKSTLVAVAGCVAQAEGSEIIRRSPVVDLVVGPQNYHRLPALLSEARGKRVIDTEFPEVDKFNHLPPPSKKRLVARGPSAFLTVQEGCDKFCSFCVVPFTRGAEISRPVAAIVEEARALAEAGVREIMLLGQNVNAYHGLDSGGQGAALAQLFEALSEIPGIGRLRYATSHPRDMRDDLIAAHRDNPKVMPYLHLPVQAGSDRILKAMNRKHNADFYRGIIDRVRKIRPDIALTSDFIVGFPGETDADFAQTIGLIEEIGYSAAYSFKYSPRPGTKAAEIEVQVPESVKDERLQALQALILKQQTAFNNAFLGKTLAVLVEKRGRHPRQMTGKSPYLQPVNFELPEGSEEKAWIGQIVDVRITELRSNSLHGTVLPLGSGA